MKIDCFIMDIHQFQLIIIIIVGYRYFDLSHANTN
uniref:Bm561 n=1 Tax=Brugia malayi TaxID=6279 RepID=A0A1I9G0W0_BRUMA|nr:Bm561 [Brugia malayi]